MPATILANRLLLNTRCEFQYDTERHWVPVAKCAAKDLAETLDAVCGESVTVEFHTARDPKGQAADLAKYSRRLAGLSGWTCSAWEHPVIRGYVQETVFACELRRI